LKQTICRRRRLENFSIFECYGGGGLKQTICRRRRLDFLKLFFEF
jgi:hypothetical protein